VADPAVLRHHGRRDHVLHHRTRVLLLAGIYQLVFLGF
jgi:hypothetical protein